MPQKDLRVVLAVVFIVLASFFAGYKWFLIVREHNLARSILDNCAFDQDKIICLQNAITDKIRKDPKATSEIFSGLLWLIQSGQLKVDARIFSDLAHEAGMEIIAGGADLERALDWCGADFKQACMHGAVMTYIDINDAEPVTSEKFAFCGQFRSWSDIHDIKYLNCLHALGHEIIAQKIQPLNEALDTCSVLGSPADSACASGVLMEYSKGESGQSSHSESPTGTILLPCDEVAERWQPLCYAGAGSYRQYYPDKESWDNTLNYCDSASIINKSNCIIGAVDRLFLAAAYDYKTAELMCGQLTADHKKYCLDALFKNYR